MEFLRLVVLMLALLSATTAGALNFEVVNAIAGTPAGKQFDRDIGVQYVQKVLAEATLVVWQTLGQNTNADRKAFDTVTLIVEGVPGRRPSLTTGSVIHLGGGYAKDQYEGPDRERFDKVLVNGVVYHEVTNVWQFDGKGSANAGLLAGIADLVQMRAGYAAPAGWASAGEGERWDERSPGVTARFLDYCDAEKPGFMAELGRKLKNRRYTEHFFVEITGKSVEKLWNQYKAKYNDV